MTWAFLKIHFQVDNFNKPLNKWDVSRVVDMSDMFSGCQMFNRPLNKWNVCRVVKMDHMFKDCPAFNQILTTWKPKCEYNNKKYDPGDIRP